MELLCLSDAPSVCFAPVPRPPSLFWSISPLLIPCFLSFSLSLALCLLSFSYLSLSLPPSLCLLFSSLLSLCVSLRKRLRHCSGGCSAGAEEIFFYFHQSVIVRSWPITLDTHIHTLMHPRAHIHTHASDVKHTLTASSSEFGSELKEKKKLSESGPASTQLTWCELR